MSLAKVGATIVGVIASVIIGGGLLLPSSYTVERSVHIDASPDAVFEFVDDMAKNELWSPWKAADPTMVISVGTPRKGKGATYAWSSDNSGAGTVTITESQRPKLVHTELEFTGMGKSLGSWTFKPHDGGTMATWTMTGSIDTPIVGPWFNQTMDGQVGPMFEDGLRRLAELASAQRAHELETMQRNAEGFLKLTPEQRKKTAEAAAALRDKPPTP